MRYLGIVKQFSNEMGFGIIGTPEGEDVFFYLSNLDHRPPEKLEGTALIFEKRNEKGRSKVFGITYLNNYKDFSLILSYLTKPHSITNVVTVNEQLRHGKLYKRQINLSYDAINISLFQLFKERSRKDTISYFKQYFDETYFDSDNIDFIEFLVLFIDTVKLSNYDNSEHEIKEQINYFLNNIKHQLLLEVWKRKFYTTNLIIKGLIDEEVEELFFEFPESFFIENYTKIEINELDRIMNQTNGSIIVSNILLKKIDELQIINQNEINQLLQTAGRIKEVELAETVKQLLSDKLLQLIIKNDYSNKSKDVIEDFHFIITKLKADIGKPYGEKAISEFNENVNDEIIFLLWQKTRYFEPNASFFEKNYYRLTYDDFINGCEIFHNSYFKNIFSDLEPIKDINAFGLLNCVIIETPVKVINEVLDKLPFAHQVSLWLNYPRMENSLGKLYEANYEITDIYIDSMKITAFFNQLGSIEEAFSSWRLVKGIQYEYSSRTQFDELSEGFRNLNLANRKKLIENILCEQDENVYDFLSSLLNRIDESQVLLLITILLKKIDVEVKISFNEITELILSANISKKIQKEIFEYISQSTSRCNRVRLWLNGHSANVEITEIINEFNTFSKDKQPMLLRKTFSLLHSKKIKSREYFLEQLLTLLDKENINLNVLICLKVLESLETKHEYLHENIISEAVCSYLDENIREVIQINDIFEKCRGRTTLTFGERNKSWSATVEGKKFSVSNNQMIIGDNMYTIDKDTKIVFIDDKSYYFSWLPPVENNIYRILNEIPAGKTFCDAVSSANDERFKRRFYWCCNDKCFAPCQEDHIHLEWNRYSLRDFIKILNLRYEDDKYYRFVSFVNRANRLFRKLQCTTCKKLLKDARTSEFAFYRVTTFHCTNPECKEYHKSVYLNHCLNWRCLNVVDSRISEKCPNGWHICDSCSNCCSQEKIEEQYKNLITNKTFNPNNPRHEKLKHQVDKKLGHLEKGEMFNYKTGEKNKAALKQQHNYTNDEYLPF